MMEPDKVDAIESYSKQGFGFKDLIVADRVSLL